MILKPLIVVMEVLYNPHLPENCLLITECFFYKVKVHVFEFTSESKMKIN